MEIVALSAVRTPIGKFGGTLKEIPVYHLGSAAMREAIRRAGLDAGEVDDCIIGCCRHTGNGTNPGRTAARYAGLPKEIPATTVTMACASGLRSVILGAQALRAGDARLILAGGMESMSTIPYILMDARWKGFRHGHKTLMDGWYDSRDPFIENKGTGAATEDLVAKHGITRAEQDQFALESHWKASEARRQGLFREEIIPISVNGQGRLPRRFGEDEIIREDTSLDKLAQLKPVFVESGTLTPGNSSAFSDGAAMLILTTREHARALGTRPLFSVISYAFGAVENENMGEGPSVVLPQALEKAGMTLRDLDFIEVNEAFAGMVLANERLLRWDRSKLNRKGGAIALGHPVGASGARILVTLYYVLKHFNGEVGAAAVGAAGGCAAAIIIRREN